MLGAHKMVNSQIDNGSAKIVDIGIGTIAVGNGKAQQGDNNALGPIYRSQAARTAWPTIPYVTTLYELFERSARKYSNRKCIGWRPIENGTAGAYKFHTYKETQGTVCVFSKTCTAAIAQANTHVVLCRQGEKRCICPQIHKNRPSR